MNRNVRPPSPMAQPIMYFGRDTQGMVLVNQDTAAITLAPRSSVTASDNGQWIFEKAATTDSDYRLKNKATGLYLTISNGKLLQAMLDNTQSQVWYCGDWYGSKWRLVNRGTSQYLGLLSGDGITEDADFKGAGSDLISISTEIGGFSDESKCATTIADGTAYYVFCRDTQGMVLVSQTTTASVEKAVNLSARSSVTASDDGQWIFEKVASTDSDYRLKNKATSLYLTIRNGKLLQATLDNSSSQVWYCGDWYGAKWRLVNRGHGAISGSAQR